MEDLRVQRTYLLLKNALLELLAKKSFDEIKTNDFALHIQDLNDEISKIEKTLAGMNKQLNDAKILILGEKLDGTAGLSGDVQNAINTLGEMNSESLEVNYRHLAESKAILALFLAKCPEEMLKIFDLVAMEATELHYPDYARIHSEIHVRISDFPTIYSLRELRESNLSSLVRVTGVVTRRTGVFPQLKYVKFNCLKCGSILGPFFQDSNEEIRISFCTNCKSKGPFRVNGEKTVYRNYQRVTLQEAPGTVPHH